MSDVEYAHRYGFPQGRPVLYAAGNFGIDESLFFPDQEPGRIVVVYPRGRRRYVNHRAFLTMAARLADDHRLKFIGVGLQGDKDAEALSTELGNETLLLTPELDRPHFAELLRSADVVVSPATSDGTPNSLVEAIACGAYIIAGKIPSISTLLQTNPRASQLDPYDEERWAVELQMLVNSGAFRSEHPRVRGDLGEAFHIDANLQRVPDFYRKVLQTSP